MQNIPSREVPDAGAIRRAYQELCAGRVRRDGQNVRSISIEPVANIALHIPEQDGLRFIAERQDLITVVRKPGQAHGGIVLKLL